MQTIESHFNIQNQRLIFYLHKWINLNINVIRRPWIYFQRIIPRQNGKPSDVMILFHDFIAVISPTGKVFANTQYFSRAMDLHQCYTNVIQVWRWDSTQFCISVITDVAIDIHNANNTTEDLVKLSNTFFSIKLWTGNIFFYSEGMIKSISLRLELKRS